ncbi:MAG: hypothetical protein JXN10_04245 [Clostridia bacterium]|nr:hypothetical protein [Clostridia bacterium]MBN2882714.1 hypothetical protein [Clostridia bacterium]
MNTKGSLAFETAIVFPMFLVLLVVLIIALARTILYENPEAMNFLDSINTVDSILRKVSIIDEVIK